jgi:hypothetical protein
VRAVGWLEAGHPYRRGPVPEAFVAALRRQVAEAYQPVLYMGFHPCSLCPEGRQRAGLRNLLVPTERLLYVAPELIAHYVEDHGYQPPEEFVAAVLACADQGSVKFYEVLRPFAALRERQA